MGEAWCLLDLDPPDQGLVARRVIEVEVDGEAFHLEFDVERTFADEAEARAFADAHGVFVRG